MEYLCFYIYCKTHRLNECIEEGLSWVLLTSFLLHVLVQVVKSVMLFPTIERMAATPQGRVMTPVLCRLRYVAYLPIFLLSLLPDVLKAFMVKLVFRGLRSLDHSTVPPTVSLINVDTAGESLPLFYSV